MTTFGQAVSIPNINVPLVDPRTKLVDEEWYRFFETVCIRTGGPGGAASDLIAGNSITIDTKANSSVTIQLGHGLEGGGNLTGNLTIEAKQDSGWTAATGTAAKGAYATYAGQTMGAAYSQTAAQALDDAVKALSQRLFAIETALRNNQSIEP